MEGRERPIDSGLSPEELKAHGINTTKNVDGDAESDIELAKFAGIDFSIIKAWVDEEWGSDETMDSEQAFEEARQAYLAELEKLYSVFKETEGGVDATSLRSYLDSLARLGAFRDRLRDSNVRCSGYDLGYRFLIDTIINQDAEIDGEMRATVQQLFANEAPYTNYMEIEHPDCVNFAREYTGDKAKLESALRSLFKRAKILNFVYEPYSPVIETGLDINQKSAAALRVWKDSLPEEYLILQSRAEISQDMTLNPEFSYALYDMIRTLNPEEGAMTRSQLWHETCEDFYRMAREEFNGDFRVPLDLMEK